MKNVFKTITILLENSEGFPSKTLRFFSTKKSENLKNVLKKHYDPLKKMRNRKMSLKSVTVLLEKT